MIALRIIRWMIGYVTFTIIGTDPQRFFTSAGGQGFHIWQMRRETETRCTGCIAARDYPQLRKIAKKRRLRLQVQSRHGLPFLLRRGLHSGKQGILFGAIGAAVLLWLLSSRVWVINVSGNSQLSAEEIRQTASEFGLYIGVGKSSYNPISVENKLMLRYPQLSWVSVNTWGSTTEIVLQEGDAAPELEDSDAVGNIVATRSGQILQMEIDHGKATVQVGDGVAPGQLLVSGVLEEEDGGVSFTKATAKIMARTHRTYSVSIPMEESVAVDTGETAQRVTLHLFNVPIPLSFCFTPDGNYRTETSSNPVTIFGVTLPITIDRETYTFQGVETVAISEEEARKRGEALLLEEVEKALENSEENGTVLSKTVSVRAETGEYIIECEFVCVENIAQEQEFFVDLKKDFPEKNDDFSEDA